jgi:HEAT repeat protein
MRLFKPNVQKMEENRDIDGLLKALQDEDADIRCRAAQALGKVGGTRAVETLGASLMNDRSVLVHRAVTEALFTIPDSRAVGPLTVALDRGADFYVCYNAAVTLWKIGDPSAVDPLIRALKSYYIHVRSVAAQALGGEGNARAVQPLLDAVKGARETREDYEKRLQATRFSLNLEQGEKASADLKAVTEWEQVFLSQVREALVAIGTAATEFLITALKNEDKGIRRVAAEALEKIGLPADPATQAWYAVVKEDWTRATALGAAAVEPLVVALKDSNSDVCSRAAEVLGRIGDVRAVEPLIVALKDSNSNVRQGAAEALGRIADVRAVEPLIAALKDSNSNVRQGAAEALGGIADVRTVEPFIAALKDSDSNVRWRAAKALDKIGLPDDLLVQIWHAVAKRDWARVTRFGSAAVEPLVAALKYSHSDVRRVAAEALVKIGAPFIEPLVATLKDSDWRVRQGAAEVLGLITDVRAVEPLIAALKDSDAVEPLIAILSYYERDYSRVQVRRDAANALVTLYRSGKLNPQAKQKILAMREVMAKPHADHSWSSDCGGHSDDGIGVTF